MDKKIINETTKEILSFLGIRRKPKTEEEQLMDEIKIYKYIVENINSNPDYVQSNSKGEEFYLETLQIALMDNPGFPDTNSILFNHLLNVVGIKNYLVKCRSNNSDSDHLANLVEIGSEFYYFDASIEKMKNSDEKELLCAAIGKDYYEGLYAPVAFLETSTELKKVDRPTNISNSSKSRALVEFISRNIPNVIRKRSGKVVSEPPINEEPEII